MNNESHPAPAAPQAEPKHGVWERDELERIIDAYVADYELSDGEVSRDLSDEDRFMLKDAIMGLLVDPAWDRAWGALIDEQARKQAEPTDQPIWKRLRDAGFTPRDNRIECDECGKRFTPQFLPIHKCEEQAEPKREPSCLWSRADDDTDVWETKCGHAFTIIDGTPTDNQMAFCCYCGRRVDEEIGGSDE